MPLNVLSSEENSLWGREVKRYCVVYVSSQCLVLFYFVWTGFGFIQMLGALWSPAFRWIYLISCAPRTTAFTVVVVCALGPKEGRSSLAVLLGCVWFLCKRLYLCAEEDHGTDPPGTYAKARGREGGDAREGSLMSFIGLRSPTTSFCTNWKDVDLTGGLTAQWMRTWS